MTRVPSGWTRASLGDIAKWGSGGTPSAGNPAFYGGDIPWAVIGDLTEGLVAVTKASITEAGLSGSSAKVVRDGAVLIAMYGASIGRLGITGRPMATNQAIAHALTNDRVNSKFLFYYLLSQRRRFVAAGKGAAQPNISQTILKAWPIDYPDDPAEQRRIVDILEDHLSRLDAALTNLHRARSMSEVLLISAVLGDAEIGAAPTEPLAGLLAEPLANGRSVPTREGGFPVLRLTSLKADGIDLTERKGGSWTEADAHRFLVRRGDFLVSRGNGSLRLVARGAHVLSDPDPVAYPDTIIRIRIRPEDIVPEYLHLIWNSPIVRRQIESMAQTTAGIYKVNQKHLVSIRIPVPGIEQQRAVSEHADEISSAADQLQHELDSATDQAEGLRRALMVSAFSGRLTGRSTDMEMVEEMACV